MTSFNGHPVHLYRLIVAGTVEGFVSPTDLAARWKYLLGAALFTLLLLFVMRKTRPAAQTRPAQELLSA